MFSSCVRNYQARGVSSKFTEVFRYCFLESLLDDETTDVVLQFFLKVLQLGDRNRSDDLLHLLVILQSFIKSFEARVSVVNWSIVTS